jgi:uncharacterized membrane protein YfcA
MYLAVPLFGFLVGFLVGLTGVGGAALMTPMLILVGGVRPLVAVGTDLMYGAVTKAVGSLVHYRRGTVDLGIAWHLGLGSIPGALLGVALINVLKGEAAYGAMDRFISRALALALIAVALSLLLRPSPRQGPARDVPSRPSRAQRRLTILFGAGIGFLVGLTSVGSGSLIAASLVTIYPEFPLRRIVGTDVFHAMCLTAVAGLAHLGLGTVDFPLLGGLLVGSIPGVWLGSRLATRVPNRVLRPVLGSLLLGIGYKLF